jgi:Outer membrane protein beta-barrel domain
MDCPAGAVSVTNQKTMDKVIVSAAAAVLVQATTVFAGEPEVSNKEPVPPPVPPPTSFFRAGEFDVGAFATYAKGFGENFGSVGEHGWGGGGDISYFPWLYAGFRLQGAVMNTIPGDRNAGDVKADVVLRYPLDLVFRNFHLAPYAFGGIGGVFTQSGSFGNFATNDFRFRNRGNRENNVLGNAGAGLEYRFTPHIGIFGETDYSIVNQPRNNFMQVNFGMRYAF